MKENEKETNAVDSAHPLHRTLGPGRMKRFCAATRPLIGPYLNGISLLRSTTRPTTTCPGL